MEVAHLPAKEEDMHLVGKDRVGQYVHHILQHAHCLKWVLVKEVVQSVGEENQEEEL